MAGHDKWNEPAMRIFGAYWDGRLTSAKSWKDDQRFADRLEEMADEMGATMGGHGVCIELGHLYLIVENIRARK